MEHCLRLALWTCLFIGYLHAKPVTSAEAQTTEGPRLRFDLADMDFDSLKKSDSCGSGVNVTSPESVETRCYATALGEFMDGLIQVAERCPSLKGISYSICEALENDSSELKQPVNLSECRWDKKPFADFVKDLETFVQRVNSS